MELIVDQYGIFIGQKSERLVLRDKGKVLQEVPFINLDQVIVISRGVSLSSDVIEKCVENGIPILFLSSNGTPFANLASPLLLGTVITRREQMRAYYDDRGVYLGKQFAKGKIGNQVNLLKYMSKYRKLRNKEEYELIQQGISSLELAKDELDKIIGQNIDEARQVILNVEGRGGALYWATIEKILPQDLGFEKREKRGASNIVNIVINYGYGILYSQIWQAILLSGMDPFAGFIHVDRPGKPSLILDLIEEFRQPVVDRVIFGLLGKNVKFEMEDDKLAFHTRKLIAQKVLERLEDTCLYQGKKHKIKTIIQRQARSVASYVREEGSYKPFIAPW
ncbi:MAG: CRISPR-associated endonuclease Cas1 [Actinobacteria bacterium]|nr:CRISPR-associated endonuclease Cas1 [Actinomycetota bacterium]